jgi:hypothetical protein
MSLSIITSQLIKSTPSGKSDTYGIPEIWKELKIQTPFNSEKKVRYGKTRKLQNRQTGVTG